MARASPRSSCTHARKLGTCSTFFRVPPSVRSSPTSTSAMPLRVRFIWSPETTSASDRCMCPTQLQLAPARIGLARATISDVTCRPLRKILKSLFLWSAAAKFSRWTGEISRCLGSRMRMMRPDAYHLCCDPLKSSFTRLALRACCTKFVDLPLARISHVSASSRWRTLTPMRRRAIVGATSTFEPSSTCLQIRCRLSEASSISSGPTASSSCSPRSRFSSPPRPRSSMQARVRGRFSSTFL
mmetsp:Transcript_57221/g.149864  ORF Transcript_57221/g.149864 Transcript_57221/m.149864 type:complete len:242 (+) Transcript_57221:557-1282(+)